MIVKNTYLIRSIQSYLPVSRAAGTVSELVKFMDFPEYSMYTLFDGDNISAHTHQLGLRKP